MHKLIEFLVVFFRSVQQLFEVLRQQTSSTGGGPTTPAAGPPASSLDATGPATDMLASLSNVLNAAPTTPATGSGSGQSGANSQAVLQFMERSHQGATANASAFGIAGSTTPGSGLPATTNFTMREMSSSDDPPGLHEKAEFILREWVNLYHSPQMGRDPTKAFSAVVQQVRI